MNRQNDISQELESMGSILAGMPRTMPYLVPDGYFDGLIAQVQEKIQAEDLQDPTTSWSKVNPYIVPVGYFEGLTQQILTTNAKTPVSISHTDPYEVPRGYFNALPGQILSAIKAEEKQPARVIPLRPNIWRQIRWSVAAVLVIGLGIGSYNIIQRSQPPQKAERMLAAIPDKDINEYIQQNIDDFDLDMIVSNTNISDDDIIQYLNETGVDTNKIE